MTSEHCPDCESWLVPCGILIFLLLLMSGCGNHAPHNGETELIAHLLKAQGERISEGASYADESGWITPNDCDGVLWSSKFGVVYDAFDPTASEYPDEPGRFNRRPPPKCREGNEDSRSTWSRDMGLGLIQYAWFRGEREILERHVSYLRGNDWFSGEPRSYDVTFYTPAMRGILYQVVHRLGGEDNSWRHTPNVYTSGQIDFRAHLMMVDILLRGETWGFIDDTMRARIIEHADREPSNAFYQVMRGRWLGDWDKAIWLCKKPNRNEASYMRCNEPRACAIAEEAWSCGLLLMFLLRNV